MILVTGGAGFIGSEVIRELTNAGLSVLAIDNFDPYYDPILKRHRWETVRNSSNVDFVEGSILDEKLMRQLFESNKFDGVINLAAMAGVRYSIEKPEKYISVNTLGSLRLLELMREFKVNNYVMASTSSLYAGCEMPFTEDSDVRFPLSPYGAALRHLNKLNRKSDGMAIVLQNPDGSWPKFDLTKYGSGVFAIGNREPDWH